MGYVSAMKAMGHVVFLVNISDSVEHLRSAEFFKNLALKTAQEKGIEMDEYKTWDTRLADALAPAKYLISNLKTIYGFPFPKQQRHAVPSSSDWNLNVDVNLAVPHYDGSDFYLQEPSIRKKRGIVDWILNGISIGTSAYALAEVNDLKKKFLAQEEFTGKLAIALKEDAMVTRYNARAIEQLRNRTIDITRGLTAFYSKEYRWNNYFSRVEAKLQEFTFSTLIQGEGVGHLTAHQLYPYLLDSVKLKQSLVELNNKAKKKNLEVAYFSISTAFEMPIMYHLVQDGFLAFLTVPLRSTEKLDLYELLPVPLALTDGRIVQLRTDKVILGIDATATKAVELTKEFVREKCLKHQDVYTCDVPIMNRHPGDFCLGALFMEDARKPLHNVCDFAPRWESTELLVPISKHEVILYTPAKVEVTLVCPQTVTNTIIHVEPGLKGFMIPELCILNTRDYSYSPAVELDHRDDKIVHRLIELSEADVAPLLAWSSEENRTMELFRQMHDHTPFNLGKLNAALADVDRLAYRETPTHGHIAIIMTVGGIILVILFGAAAFGIYWFKGGTIKKWIDTMTTSHNIQMSDLTKKTEDSERFMSNCRQDHRDNEQLRTNNFARAAKEMEYLAHHLKAAVEVITSEEPTRDYAEIRTGLLKNLQQLDLRKGDYGTYQWHGPPPRTDRDHLTYWSQKEDPMPDEWTDAANDDDDVSRTDTMVSLH
jgi:predicted aspartyl protease